ncbi:MAG: leucine-rich repeat domain-containing protein [Sedimentisphaerales bacterium]|nr:leucine-rich repeat domain-containing protein [Sedimentisphaerales bacterium]
MRNLFILIIVCILSGCAYVENRARDAADMITISGEAVAVGATIGVANRVHLSPFYLGGGYGFGLRSGAIGLYQNSQMVCFFFPFANDFSPSKFDSYRGKGYSWDFIEFQHSGEWFNLGQIEAAVGLGVGVRAGINIFEIADFFVGFAGIDICNDDIAGVNNNVIISETVASQLNKKTDKLLDSDYQRIADLDLSGKYISDIKILSKFQNLRKLNLSGTMASDITPLSNLKNLRELHLSAVKIRDITPLSGLTNLRELHLINNKINDISPLSGLINLEKLELSYTNVIDISSLKNLINLRVLDLRSTKVSDIKPLSNLENLSYLIVADAPISDFSPLENLKKFRMLEISRRKFSNEQVAELKKALPNVSILRH